MVSGLDVRPFDIQPALAAFGAGREIGRQRREDEFVAGQRNALAAAGGAAAKGQIGEAQNTLLRAGNLQGADYFRQQQAGQSEAERARQAEIRQGLAAIAANQAIPDEQWPQAVEQYLRVNGTPEDLADLPIFADPQIRPLLAGPGESYTLSPGETRFQGTTAVANVPETPEPVSPGFRQLSAEEVAKRNLDPALAWQVGPDGRVHQIGGAGVNVSLTTVPDLSSAMEQQAISLTNQAATLENQVTELEQLRDVAAVTPTGFWENATLGVRRALVGLGWIEDETVQGQELLQGLQNQQALRLRNPDSGFGLTGNTSDRDVSFLLATVPNLVNTQQANMAIATILLAKQRRAAELASLQADYIWQNGNLQGWSEYRREYIENSPFLTPEEEQWVLDATGMTREEAGLAAPAQQPQTTTQTPTVNTTGQRATDEAGTMYYEQPDGRWLDAAGNEYRP